MSSCSWEREIVARLSFLLRQRENEWSEHLPFSRLSFRLHTLLIIVSSLRLLFSELLRTLRSATLLAILIIVCHGGYISVSRLSRVHVFIFVLTPDVSGKWCHVLGENNVKLL